LEKIKCCKSTVLGFLLTRSNAVHTSQPTVGKSAGHLIRELHSTPLWFHGWQVSGIFAPFEYQMDNNISKVKPSFLMLMKLKIPEKLMAAEDSSNRFCSGTTSKRWTREIDFGEML
jgi:hypothetical protein